MRLGDVFLRLRSGRSDLTVQNEPPTPTHHVPLNLSIPLGRSTMRREEGFVKRFLSKLLPRWLTLSRGRDRNSPERLAQEAVRLYEQGRYREARTVAAQLVDVQRESLGESHPDYASALSNLGILLYQQAELDAAEPLLRQALEVRRAALGEHDPQFASSLNHLADLLQARGDLSGAEPLLRQALDVRKHALGEHHPDYATGLTGLAFSLSRGGEFASAEPMLQQALAIRKEALGEHHPMTATAVSNLGLFLQSRGDLVAAEPLLRRSLELRREALGVQHPDYAASLSHLASLLIAKDNPAGAEPLLRRAIEVRKAILGQDHPDVQADLRAIEKIRKVSESQTLEAIRQVKSPAVPHPPAPASLPLTPHMPKLIINAITEPATASLTAMPEPEATPTTTVSRALAVITGELRALELTFMNVGERLVDAGRLMQSSGLEPEPALLEEAIRCQKALAKLRDEAIAGAKPFGVSPEVAVPGLGDLATLLDRAAKAEEERPLREAVLRKASSMLDRALSLCHVDATQALLLQPTLAAADNLKRAALAASPNESIPSEIGRLADGSHPIAALIRFATMGTEVPDQEWSRLHRAISTALGKPLAAAAARKRLLTSAIAAEAAVDLTASTSPRGRRAISETAHHDLLDAALNRLPRVFTVRLGAGSSQGMEAPK